MHESFGLLRRLAGTLGWLCLAATPSLASSNGLATLDWTLAETLVALDAAPDAVAQVEDYHNWVGEPPLPGNVLDIGLRSQPNVELLAHLEPETILISPMFGHLAPRLEQIGAVDTREIYTPQGDTWNQILTLTRVLGMASDRRDEAEALIAATEARFESLRQALPEEAPPLLVVQFMDERHVRVFGVHGLFQAVMERLGLENAWQGETNYWGFSMVGLEELLGLEARLVVVEPYPIGAEEKLADSALWQHHPSVRDGNLITLPPVWSFGALPSAQRFAELLVAALVRSPDA
ncbi:ABC transporter substrate-binding protein [Billgrantia diversa]|uniref:ABC transporter substrate-binding protein n=1 Tax=Halomonas sp. MCCC 1A13316 TaxID=2733487 RepID=UPI0018A5E655|nr:ABC transporter substrate-binding protein [Halomonas sp. MCCC 1A13316]QOR38442.1 ABC transporter substrate-binding protein [Halomonas sp. MCCC 1A13316]